MSMGDAYAFLLETGLTTSNIATTGETTLFSFHLQT